MEQQILIVQIISFLVSVGVIYGSFSTRIKTLEKDINDHKDIKERLAKIEVAQKIIIDNFIQNK